MTEIERPDTLTGPTIRKQTSCGYLYITYNTSEVFARLGKSGGCAASQTEALGRLISIALRYGVPLREITTQLRGIQCNAPCGGIKSCADAIAQALEEVGG